MSKTSWRILSIDEYSGYSLRLAANERPLRVLPGQYLAATLPAEISCIPATLFPLRSSGEELWVTSPKKLHVHVGQTLLLRGALGNGFHLPPYAEKIALLAAGAEETLSLVPLALALLEQGKEVTLVSDQAPGGLPAVIELLPLAQAQDAAVWADALAICSATKMITHWIEKYGKGATNKPAQLMVFANFPCAGMADCGICALPTRSGWKLACKDGPVFDLETLVNE